MNQDDLLDAFREMTLLELSEFRKVFEETFGVEAAAPVVAHDVPGSQEADGPPQEEQTEFTVTLTAIGNTKIQVIKAVRQILPELGLAQAKERVDAVPVAILTNVSQETAQRARDVLSAAGAQVQMT
jgi:large subunit ribosomal protein L7/L12